MHFELVKLYASPWSAGGNTAANSGIPIVLTPALTLEQAQAKPGRATKAEVYQQVINDLTKAASLLPEKKGIRVNQPAAKALLARVYLQQGNYALARDAANAVIESRLYGLNPIVTVAFNNRNSAESIFEIQQNEQNNAGRANDGMATFYACFDGVGRADVEILGSHLNLYEGSDMRLTELVYLGGSDCSKPNRARTGKWTDPAQNLPVIRLAEMYLIRAEANFRLNTSVGATALQDVNLIRTRAGASKYVTVDLEKILLERQLELAFEGNRLHDIKRTKGNLTPNIPYDSPLLVLPIPQREIDVNGNLIQNTGY
jgi:starch-binding outer membrane protein, SusD/RagB family